MYLKSRCIGIYSITLYVPWCTCLFHACLKQPFLINFLKIFTESDMQPNGAFELLDMFNGALAKLWMIDIVIDIKFYSTVFLFAVFLLA